jgi:hypothetical protein
MQDGHTVATINEAVRRAKVLDALLERLANELDELDARIASREPLDDAELRGRVSAAARLVCLAYDALGACPETGVHEFS